MAPPKVVQKASVKSRLGPVKKNGGAKKVFNGPKKTKRDSAEEKKLRKKLNRKQNKRYSSVIISNLIKPSFHGTPYQGSFTQARLWGHPHPPEI